MSAAEYIDQIKIIATERRQATYNIMTDTGLTDRERQVKFNHLKEYNDYRLAKLNAEFNK